MIGRSVTVFCGIMLCGVVWWSCADAPRTIGPPVTTGQARHALQQLCEDSTHMTVVNFQDIGGGHTMMQLRRPGEKGECDTAFGKIERVKVTTVRPPKKRTTPGS